MMVISLDGIGQIQKLFMATSHDGYIPPTSSECSSEYQFVGFCTAVLSVAYSNVHPFYTGKSLEKCL